MSLNVKETLVGQLDWYWSAMLRPRLKDLGDQEYFWETIENCWTVRQDDQGHWVGDWASPAPEPAPLTTIAWRLAHITTVLAGRAAAHFGTKPYDFQTAFAGDAAGAVDRLEEAYTAWHAGVDGLTDAKLTEQSEGPPGTLDGQHPFAAVIQHVNREVIHHGAEVAVLRDLYRHHRLREPLVVALLDGDRASIEEMTTKDPRLLATTKAKQPDLAVAAAERGLESLKLVAEFGWDVSAQMRRSALHTAAARGDVDLAMALVELGADRDARDADYGATPAEWAGFFGHHELARGLAGEGGTRA